MSEDLESRVKAVSEDLEVKQIKIRFGAQAPTLRDQLNEQGYKYDTPTIMQIERAAHGLFELRMLGVVADRMHQTIQAKIFKKVTSHINKKNPQP
jgi:hypothetical protein